MRTMLWIVSVIGAGMLFAVACGFDPVDDDIDDEIDIDPKLSLHTQSKEDCKKEGKMHAPDSKSCMVEDLMEDCSKENLTAIYGENSSFEGFLAKMKKKEKSGYQVYQCGTSEVFFAITYWKKNKDNEINYEKLLFVDIDIDVGDIDFELPTGEDEASIAAREKHQLKWANKDLLIADKDLCIAFTKIPGECTVHRKNLADLEANCSLTLLAQKILSVNCKKDDGNPCIDESDSFILSMIITEQAQSGGETELTSRVGTSTSTWTIGDNQCESL